MNVLEGKLTGTEDIKIGIVAARFNEFIVSRLIGGALDGLKRHDVPEEQIDLAWVPGAFEIPVIAEKMAASGKYDAVICLGAVIRGQRAIMIMCAMKFPKGLQAFPYRAKFRLCLASLRQTILNRQSSAQAVRREIRGMNALWVRSRW
mgnify:CR=1 FL=1